MTNPLHEIADPLRELRTRFELEIEPHRAELWQYCRRLTGSAWDAEDLVQETLQRALANLANLWQAVDPRAYVFRIATNAWIDRKRVDARAELRELFDELPSRQPDLDARVDAHAALGHLVRVLTPLQRVVFLLCETLGFRAREAAQVLGTTEGAVKAALHRARVSLADSVEESESGGARLTPPENMSELVQRYVAAFDARDPDAIAALLHEEAVTTVVGTAEELGREMSRSGSLAEWAEEPAEQWAKPGTLDGREVLFIFTTGEGRQEALYSMIELKAAGEAVMEQKIYYFSPELLDYAAEALGVPAHTHGHWYVPGA